MGFPSPGSFFMLFPMEKTSDAYRRGLKLLAMREHCAKELLDKLVSKGHSKEEAGEAVARLEKEGWLSDRRYAEAFVRSRLKRGPEGKSLIEARLAEKGVPRQLAREVVSAYFEENAEEIRKAEEAFAAAETAKKGREKAARGLARRGLRLQGRWDLD